MSNYWLYKHKPESRVCPLTGITHFRPFTVGKDGMAWVMFNGSFIRTMELEKKRGRGISLVTTSKHIVELVDHVTSK